jgi:SAM-dependent methyltransferase
LVSTKVQFVTEDSGAADQGLWTKFWQEFAAESEVLERCHIPGDGRELVDAHWQQFANHLPQEARMVDLGCGAGIVGRTLLKQRSDVVVDGIDLARVPQPNVANLTIHRWVSMEALPFEANSIDAAVSLDGIEYGNLSATAVELQRVLRPGSSFSFLIHHADSEIVREGTTIRRALRHLFGGKIKSAFLAGNTERLDQQIRAIGKELPGEPTVAFATKFFNSKISLPRVARESAWHDFVNNLSPEAALLARLERAAKTPGGIAIWLEPLIVTMQQVSVAVMRRRSTERIAWKVAGIR